MIRSNNQTSNMHSLMRKYVCNLKSEFSLHFRQPKADAGHVKGSKLQFRDKWVPVTTACSVLRLWLKERPSVWRETANILN